MKPNYTIVKIVSMTSIFLFYSLLVMVAVLQFIMPRENVMDSNRIYKFDASWVWIKPDGTEEAIDIPYNGAVPWGETMVIETTVPDYVTDADAIMFRTSQQTVNAYIGDELRYVHDTSDSRLFGQNSNSINSFVDFKTGDAGKTLRIELVSKSNFSGVVKDIYYGNKVDLWYSILSDNMLEFVMDSFMLVLGIMIMFLSVYFRIKHNPYSQIRFTGYLILVNAVFCISDCHIREVIFPNSSVVGDITYIVGILLFQSLLSFMDYTQERQYHRIYVVIEMINVVILPIIIISCFTGLFEIYNTIYVIIALVIVSFACFVYTVIKDIKCGRIKKYLGVAIGIILYELSVIAGFVFTNVIYILDGYGIFLSASLTFLFFMSLQKTASDISASEFEKQRAIYERDIKERFFATVSHELRTPLNSVIGMNELILKKTDNEEIIKYALNANSSGKILLSLINDLLDFSKMESGRLSISESEYDVRSLLAGAVNLVKDTAEKKKLQLISKSDGHIPSRLRGDEVRIKQILTNLLNNAVKYTKEGSVTFTADCENVDGVFFLIFSVSDTGQGIKPENIDHLFESFSRFEEQSNKYIEGTGLGLAITKNLVDMMGGTIKVTSEFGKGSEFCVRIPQTVTDWTSIGDFDIDSYNEEYYKKQSKIISLKSKILVADDNEMNRFIVSEYLKQLGLESDMAQNGREALDMAMKQKYDIIFMDHYMPVMDGVEAVGHIREEEKSMSKTAIIIALTANAYSGIREEYMEKGFDDYLSKPIETDEFENMIAKCLHVEV